MKIKHNCKNCHNTDTITILDTTNHTGRTAWKPTMKDLEFFIKEEIALTKTCGCCSCNYRRIMFRFIQYIIKENIELKKRLKCTNKCCALKRKE